MLNLIKEANKKVNVAKGMAVACGAAALFLAGCATETSNGPSGQCRYAQNNMHMEKQSCKGVSSCKGTKSCHSKVSCKSKKSCKAKSSCKGKHSCHANMKKHHANSKKHAVKAHAKQQVQQAEANKPATQAQVVQQSNSYNSAYDSSN